MPKFRALKIELKTRLEAPDWQDFLPILAGIDARKSLGPLLGLLLHGDEMAGRAASAIGVSVAALAAKDLEAARVIMRRLMWSMNEESGNIGWGIPQSMAEILARSPALAGEFNRVLISYIRDTGGEDNYVDHVPLLRYCFWAVGRLAQARPLLVLPALGSLGQGLEHEDVPVRGQAALALGRLFEALLLLPGPEAQKAAPAPWRNLAPLLEKLEREPAELDFFDGAAMRREPIAALARTSGKALSRWEKALKNFIP